MKRFWLFLLMLAGTLAVLTAPAFADDDSDSDDINSAMGSISARVGEVEKTLGLKFSGDIRFREEYFYQDQDNKPTGVSFINNTIKDRLRTRVRLRFAADKTFSSEVKAGFRVTSGTTLPSSSAAAGATLVNSADPTSTNQTLGAEGTDKPFVIDRVWMNWSPSLLENKLDIILGKMPNPLAFTPITWDDDTNPEGVAFDFHPLDRFHVRGLYFILQENSSQLDQYLLDAQVEKGFNVGDLDLTVTGGFQYVPWVSGFLKTIPATYTLSPTGNDANWFVSSNGMIGNATPGIGGLIPDMHVFDGIIVGKHKVGAVPFVWTFAAAYNANSFVINHTTVPAVLAGVSDRSNSLAMFGRLAVGAASDPGAWAGSIEYGYIEPNAVFGLFSDSDSGPGYNNTTWLKEVVEVGLAANLNFKLGQYEVWRANYDILGQSPNASLGGTSQQPEFRTQADLVVKL